jgi:hypothetical protein
LGAFIVKVAVVGSRDITIENLRKYLPPETSELVSGGAAGADTSAREYANRHGIKLTEFLPEYRKYGRGAPLKRNIQIITYSNLVLAFWNGMSRGTKFVIDSCRERAIPVYVIRVDVGL